MGGMLEVAARFGETQKAPHLKRELARVANAVNIAENELDNLPGGRLAHRPLAEALLSILALAERFAFGAMAVADGLTQEVKSCLPKWHQNKHI